MEATYKTAEDFGADVISWVIEELPVKDRNSLTKRLGKYAADNLGGSSVKGIWWKRANILKNLYSKATGGTERKHNLLMGLLFDPIRDKLAALPECRDAEEADRAATAEADRHEGDEPKIYLDQMNRRTWSRRQILYLILMHIGVYRLDALLPCLGLEKDAKGKRDLTLRKTPVFFNDGEKDKSAAYSLVMNAGKTVDNVVMHEGEEKPDGKDAGAAATAAKEGVPEAAEEKPEEAAPQESPAAECPTYVSEADALAKEPHRRHYKAGKHQEGLLRNLIYFAVRAVPKEEREAVGRYLRRKVSLFPKFISLKGTWWEKPAVIARLAGLSYPAAGGIAGAYLSYAFAASISDAGRFPRSIGFFRRVMHGDRSALEELRCVLLTGADPASCARIIFLFAAGRS
ncbi:MAG: hypothetical protein ACI4SY_05050, partial [Sutterella sp.]